MKVIVGGIIHKNNKILMVQEAQEKCYGQWNFPAGHLNDGEHIFEGALREIFEETGCKVKLTKVLPIISLKERSLIRITFVTELIEENIKFDKSEILDVKWIDIDEIKKMDENTLRIQKMNLEILNHFENKIYFPLELFREQ